MCSQYNIVYNMTHINDSLRRSELEKMTEMAYIFDVYI